jgi:hypothetical protein
MPHCLKLEIGFTLGNQSYFVTFVAFQCVSNVFFLHYDYTSYKAKRLLTDLKIWVDCKQS